MNTNEDTASIEIQVERNQDDFLAYHKLLAPPKERLYRYAFTISSTLIFVPLLTIGVYQLATQGTYGILIASLLFLGMVTTPFLTQPSFKQRYRRSNPGKATIQLSQAGLHQKNDFIDKHLAWSSIREIKEIDSHLFIMVDEREAILIPHRVFASTQDYMQFRDQAESFKASA